MLEQITLDPLVAAAAALLGVLLGLLLGRLFLPGPREVKRLRAEIEGLRREHTEYQSRVAGHFKQTGELVGQMTASYKAVYDHLAEGAQTLCGADALPKPPFGAPRLIVDETLSIGGDGPRPAVRLEVTPDEPQPVAIPALDAAERDGAPHASTPTEGAPAHTGDIETAKPF